MTDKILEKNREIRAWVEEQFVDCNDCRVFEEVEDSFEDDDCDGDITYYKEGNVKFKSYKFEYEYMKTDDSDWELQRSNIKIEKDVDEDVKKFIENNYTYIEEHSIDWLPADFFL